MSDDARHIIDQALHLPVSGRARVVAELLASMDTESDPEATREWAAEIQRRAERALRGDSKGKRWDEIRAEIQAKRRPQ